MLQHFVRIKDIHSMYVFYPYKMLIDITVDTSIHIHALTYMSLILQYNRRLFITNHNIACYGLIAYHIYVRAHLCAKQKKKAYIYVHPLPPTPTITNNANAIVCYI
jgi:hypothetical protein